MCKEAHYTPQKALLDLLTIRYTKKLFHNKFHSSPIILFSVMLKFHSK